jgi:uncharacterized beta-barrel protein YwiB (DUF1934 family)
MEPMPVRVSINTSIIQAGVKDEITTGGTGFYYTKENETYLQYEERTAEGSIRTIIKMDSGKALLLRSGDVKMRLPFRLGEETRGTYETQYGTMPIMALTDKLVRGIRENGKGGLFRLTYDLNIAGAPAGTYSLAIMFEEENQ